MAALDYDYDYDYDYDTAAAAAALKPLPPTDLLSRVHGYTRNCGE
jgi:hypothetical protein